jgi:hypothetical protein
VSQTAAATHSPEAAAAVFVVRLMEPGDLAFVTDSWLRSAWSPEAKKVKAGLRAQGAGVAATKRGILRARFSWFDAVRPRVTALIADVQTVTLVACDREDRNHIAGWVATRDGLELRSYVKDAYRPWGVDALLRSAMEGLR